MKKVFYTVMLMAVVFLSASCGARQGAAPQTIADVVPFWRNCNVYVPMDYFGGIHVNVPTNEIQAETIIELLNPVSLEGFEPCEPNSIVGSGSVTFFFENADDPEQTCSLYIIFYDKGGITSYPPPKDVYPENTCCLTFGFNDGSRKAFLGVWDFPYSELSRVCSDVWNDTEESEYTGTGRLLEVPDRTWTIWKTAALVARAIFDKAVTDSPAECQGGYDGELVLQGVTYLLDFDTGCFSREEDGRIVWGRLDEEGLLDILFKCGFPIQQR